MLIPCPYCDHEVIEGADECDACGQPLTEFHLPVPATAVERALLTDRVRLFQGRKPLTVSPRTSVREVLRMLADNKVGCLLVEEDGKTVGIFTERDVLLKLGEKAAELGLATGVADEPGAAADELVAEIMTRSPDAVAAAKRLFERTGSLGPRRTFARERAEQLRLLLRTPNTRRAQQAAFARATPEFAPRQRR